MPTTPARPGRPARVLSYALAAFSAFAAVQAFALLAGMHDCSAPGSIWPGPVELALIDLIFISPLALAAAVVALVLHALVTTFAPRAFRGRVAYAVPVLTLGAFAVATLVALAHPAAGCRIDF